MLELRRADGTTTWERRQGATAEFFAVHDLTHFAVETTLGCTSGFYGLVASGWDLADFRHPWPRGPLSAEATAVEVIVGCFDTQRAAHLPLTAAECNTSLDSWHSARDTQSPLHLTDAQLDAIRSRLSELVWRWHALPPGEEMGLAFG